jgi:hypothetical protein
MVCCTAEEGNHASDDSSTVSGFISKEGLRSSGNSHVRWPPAGDARVGDFEGMHGCINAAKGRVKDRNMWRDPRVTLTIQDRDNLYRYLEVRGRVVEITEAGTDAHIDSLAKRYLGGEVSVSASRRGTSALQNPARSHCADGIRGNGARLLSRGEERRRYRRPAPARSLLNEAGAD